MDIAQLRVGQKVHYIPYDGCDESEKENGIIKEIDEDAEFVYVVFKCAGDWTNYQKYTSCLVDIKRLNIGWIS